MNIGFQYLVWLAVHCQIWLGWRCLSLVGRSLGSLLANCDQDLSMSIVWAVWRIGLWIFKLKTARERANNFGGIYVRIAPLSMLLLILGTLCFLVTGPYRAWHWSYDFVSVYCGSRCLLYGCNPYDMAAVEQQYTLSGGTDPHFHSQAWRHSQPPVYPPSTFVAMIPFALLELPAAQDLWIVINTLLLVAAVFYFISSVSDSYRWLANLFGAFFLGISPGTLHWGNPALLAISLLILSCSLYRRERMPVLAAGLLCVSLALKPQIGGVGGAISTGGESTSRRSAAAAIATAVALLLIGAATLQSHVHKANTGLPICARTPSIHSCRDMSMIQRRRLDLKSILNLQS